MKHLILKYYNVIKITEDDNSIINYVLNEKDKICYENFNIFKNIIIIFTINI